MVLRCPTRHFRNGHIQWLKDGKPLVSLTHLSITPTGYMKIQQIRASDAGIYTCVAGAAHEHFVLQVIGSKQKLSFPQSWRLADGQQKVVEPDAALARERVQELPIALNRYDAIVEHLLELKTSFQDEKDTADKRNLSDKKSATPQDESSELSSLIVLIADTHRLDEVTHNLSGGGLRGEELLTTQLLSELIVTHGETNESTHHPPERSQSSTQVPLVKAHVSRPRIPAIIQRTRKVEVLPSTGVIVHVGAPVSLQKHVSSLELRCEVLGNPEPSLTWTKNGKKLHYNSR